MDSPINISVDLLIIGAGPTGLGAATKLQELDKKNYLLIDRASVPGGLAATEKTPENFVSCSTLVVILYSHTTPTSTNNFQISCLQ